jgi:hypothetical protein
LLVLVEAVGPASLGPQFGPHTVVHGRVAELSGPLFFDRYGPVWSPALSDVQAPDSLAILLEPGIACVGFVQDLGSGLGVPFFGCPGRFVCFGCF